MRMPRAVLLAAVCGFAAALPMEVPPPHARRGRLGQLHPEWALADVESGTAHYITCPLDHFDDQNKDTIKVRYWTDESYLNSTGPIFVHMAGESPASGVHASTTEKKYSALALGYEHRFYGKSLPNNGGGQSLANLQFLTVEQQLADLAMIIERVQKSLPSRRVAFAFGGSYSGATCAWFRMKYPDVVAGCRSSSGVVNAVTNFTAFDTRVATAIASPDAACPGRLKAGFEALERAFAKGDAEKARVKKMFNASNLIGTPLGDADFFYGVADATAQLDQYGEKKSLCEGLALLPADPSDEERMSNLGALIDHHYGSDFVAGEFYDSEALKRDLGVKEGGMDRAWRYQKCRELAYLQPAPAENSMRGTKYLTLDALLQQCAYVFNGTQPDTAAFDRKYYDKLATEASNIVFLDYSDDPWQEASVKSQLSPSLPYCMTTCDGCGHCGSGVPRSLSHCSNVADGYVAKWLSEAAPPREP